MVVVLLVFVVLKGVPFRWFETTQTHDKPQAQNQTILQKVVESL